MIELYKTFAGNYDDNTTEWITGKCIGKQHDTRNHRFALQQWHVHYDMRKFNFTNRVISVWNTLPYTVVSANTIDTFKARLDKFWSDQNSTQPEITDAGVWHLYVRIINNITIL